MLTQPSRHSGDGRVAAAGHLLAHPYRFAVGSLILCGLAALAGYGSGIEGLQAVTRYTGRAGLLWFALIFSLAPLHRLAPGEFTRSALPRRRQLGLAFGLHHTVHLALLLTYLWASGNPLDPSRAAGGVVGYVALFAMMATSSDAAVRALGGRSWKRLHRASLWYLWIAFLMTYIPRLQGKLPHVGGGQAEFVACTFLTLAIAALRAAAWMAARQRVATPAGEELG